MKRLSLLVAAILLSAVTVQPVFARTCPKVIKEGRDLLATTKLSKADSGKIKTLLDDADKAHDGGDHGEALKKAREALALLKKK